MSGKTHYFILFLLLLVLVSAIAGCGGGSTETLTNGATSGSGGGGNAAAGTVSLSWNAPTANVDGTPLTDLAGYKLHYGTTSGVYTFSLVLGNVTNYAFALPAGTYYFALSAYDTLGLESGLSNELIKKVL